MDQATVWNIGLREPLPGGKIREVKIKREFGELPSLTEAIIIGCPDWDDLGVYNSFDTLEIHKCNITMPTWFPGANDPSEKILRLNSELCLPHTNVTI